MDYLFEVLDKWEAMKKNPELKHKVPRHNIKIEVLSGASAGGMTAAIAAIVLQQREKNSARVFNAPESDPNRLKQNPFYDAWVNLTKDDMTDELLKDKDAVTLPDKTTSVISAFNSRFISTVAERALPEKSAGLSLKNSEYVSEKLRVFVTLTNLTGFSRVTRLSADTPDASRFITQDHRDLALFRFNQRAGNQLPDGSIEVDLESGKNVDILRCAAVATGAFPFGLAYKTLTRRTSDIDNNVLLKELYGQHNDFHMPPDEYSASFIDGGLINNEPFELTETLLVKQIAGKCEADSERFYSTTLMIDPFPSDVLLPVVSETSDFPYNFTQIVAKFISTVRSQVLVKTSLIDAAFDEDNFRCFVMSPRRREYGDKITYFNGDKAIASGTLAGFGGFLEKDFREHDFFLGRINCKSFLQNHFKVPADTENPIFKDAYPPEIINDFLIDGDDGKKFLPIIPDVNKIDEPLEYVDAIYRNLKFPSTKSKQFKKRFDDLNPKILRRLKYFIETNFVDFKTRFYLKTALFLLKKKLLAEIYRIIRQDLEEWKILQDK